MAFPSPLPTPPVVQQPPARCWSAALESWDTATGRVLGYQQRHSMQSIQDMLDPDGVSVDANGRATMQGMDRVALHGNIRWQAFPSAAFSPTVARRILADHGYIYCAYYWPAGGHMHGHALVIYRAGPGGFAVMDPDPRRGLIPRAPNFFAAHSAAVLIGTTIFAPLQTMLDSFMEENQLAPGTAADIMSQVQ